MAPLSKDSVKPDRRREKCADCGAVVPRKPDEVWTKEQLLCDCPSDQMIPIDEPEPNG